MDIPPGLMLVWWTLAGLLVGSFVNVAIHRLPLEGETVSHPRRSRCPQCRHTLSWKENVPVLSWALQRGRCRHCGWRIPVRYPLVELLTAGLWLWLAWVTPTERWDLLLVRIVVVTGLVVATFVDFDCFEIPDEVSIGGMVLAPIASLLVPSLHDATSLARMLSEDPVSVSRLGALSGCLAGMVAGGGLLWVVGVVGTRVYGREAMGFGDVKLLAAGGGFVGPGGVLVALMVASVLASVAGVANMLRFFVLVRARARARGTRKSLGRSVQVARIAGRYIPFGPYLAAGIGIVLVHWNDVLTLVTG